MLYPLIFDYVTKDYIWGGQRLCRYSRPLPESQRLAESWEISTHPHGPSRVKNGPEAGKLLSELVREYGAELLGTEANSSEFPFLIKLIDAASNLSIQVHPDDEVAAQLDPPSLGKNELWYVLDAPENAKLICGLRDPSKTKAELSQAIKDNQILDALAELPVSKGDLINIPAGTIHAITEGLFIAEIQQNSDITYRLYDYDRVDADGNKRPLHIEAGLNAAKLGPDSKHIFPGLDAAAIGLDTPAGIIKRKLLLDNRYFHVESYQLDKSFKLAGDPKRFQAFILLSGSLRLQNQDFNFIVEPMNSFLIPANCPEFEVISTGDETPELLLATLPIESERRALRSALDAHPEFRDCLALEP